MGPVAVLEVSPAGFFWRREVALELVCRADFVQPALQDEPRRSRGVLGPSLAEHRPKTGPKSSGQTASRHPVQYCTIQNSIIYHPPLSSPAGGGWGGEGGPVLKKRMH